jgi:hypothetical protein
VGRIRTTDLRSQYWESDSSNQVVRSGEKAIGKRWKAGPGWVYGLVTNRDPSADDARIPHMPLILILVILLLVFGGGGYYMGPGVGYYGGGGLSLVLLIVILFLLFGRGRTRL